MKPIKLTLEQVENLLEMVKDLFPNVSEGGPTLIKVDKYIRASDGGLFIYFHRDDGPIRIHWFEFCLKILASEISFKQACDGPGTTIDLRFGFNLRRFLHAVILEENHPVDYLYKEYKLWKSSKT